jgi:hypothetical protein
VLANPRDGGAASGLQKPLRRRLGRLGNLMKPKASKLLGQHLRKHVQGADIT